ncbi:MAG: hypothetical protein F6J87_09720 [Spirulina sp. SIO3F2]|nr:hypothetical protein [Spirulina sp. SIO3F2]
MSLIERLEFGDWQGFLEQSFETAIQLLAEDRFQWAGSSVDDLKSWLATGGVHRVQQHLNRQMNVRRFSIEHKKAVNKFLSKLVQRNRCELLSLMADQVIPMTQAEWLAVCGLSGTQFDELLSRLLAGENPFEEWMHQQGRSQSEINAVYRCIDDWLLNNQINMLPNDPNLN